MLRRLISLPVGLACLVASALGGCTTIQGYAHDPEDNKATLDALAPYFGVAKEAAYTSETDAAKRQQLRNEIVLNRIRVYDIEFARFERTLYGSGTGLSMGADLSVLVLNGVGAVTGGEQTKAALAAASGGIVGAQGVVNKDLFYQRTLPALLAAMEANRAKAKVILLDGLKVSDTEYPLGRAQLDLISLKQAGGIPGAVNDITQQAQASKALAEAAITPFRSLTVSRTSTTSQLQAWLKVGDPNANMARLQAWMEGDPVDPVLHQLPPEVLVSGSSSQLEADRQRAIDALLPKEISH